MRTTLDPVQARYAALLHVLRTAETLWEASRRYFTRWDLSPAQFNVLNLLGAGDGGLSQTGLSRQLLTHRSNVTGLVDRLERRGLVSRADVPGDRRSYSVEITPAGRALLREILPSYHATADRVWQKIPAARIPALVADLEILGANALAVVAAAPARPAAPPVPPRPARRARGAAGPATRDTR